MIIALQLSLDAGRYFDIPPARVFRVKIVGVSIVSSECVEK